MLPILAASAETRTSPLKLHQKPLARWAGERLRVKPSHAIKAMLRPSSSSLAGGRAAG